MHEKRRKGTYLTATEQDFKKCKSEKHIQLSGMVEYRCVVTEDQLKNGR